MDEIYLANLTYLELRDALESDRTIVLLLPLGATEPHGPHAPLATDPIISIGICERVAQQTQDDPDLRVLILPVLSYGVTRYAGGFPGAIHIREETLQAVVTDVCASLRAQGFSYVMLVNNHFEPEHVQTLHACIDQLEIENGLRVGYLDLTRKERARRLTEEFRLGECHAGRYETSLVLADHPGLVDQVVMSRLPHVPVNLAQMIAEGLKDFREMKLTEAYCGSPAEATPEEGEESFRILTAMTIDLVRALVAGKGGRDHPGLFGRV